MLGTGLQFGQSRGEDRFYNSARARKAQQSQRANQLRRAQSDISPSQSFPVKENHAYREPENRVGSNDPSKPMAVPPFDPVSSSSGNLECFLHSIMPSVHIQYLSKVVFRIGVHFIL